jgi:UDP-GlcNAc:undecaprenyl-phosphate GlcNAc-1-phosphate transferase
MVLVMLPFAAVFIVCTFLMLILIRMAPALRLMDSPGGRRQHKQATPLVGGISIGLSAFALLIWPEVLYASVSWLSWFWPPLLLLMIIGVLDDRLDISANIRLLSQVVASFMMIFGAGVELTNIGNVIGTGPLFLGVLAIPVTVFAVTSSINAFNMMDGLDGLAGGLSLIPLVAFTVISLNAELPELATLGGAFSVSCMAFMAFNYRFPWLGRARVFLGDTGSMILGFTIAWLAIGVSEAGAISAVTVLYLIAIPLFDTAAVIVRRQLSGRKVTNPGRDHVHHILRGAGLSVNVSVAVIHLAGVFGALIGLSLSYAGVAESTALAVFVVMLGLYIMATRSPESAQDRLRSLLTRVGLLTQPS